jgi:transcriptional regulator with XRE-family HTH domain
MVKQNNNCVDDPIRDVLFFRPMKKLTRLASWMRENGLSQPEAAEMLKVHQTYVAHLVNGKRQPSSRLTLVLESVTGIPKEYFRPDVYKPARSNA